MEEEGKCPNHFMSIWYRSEKSCSTTSVLKLFVVILSRTMQHDSYSKLLVCSHVWNSVAKLLYSNCILQS